MSFLLWGEPGRPVGGLAGLGFGGFGLTSLRGSIVACELGHDGAIDAIRMHAFDGLAQGCGNGRILRIPLSGVQQHAAHISVRRNAGCGLDRRDRRRGAVVVKAGLAGAGRAIARRAGVERDRAVLVQLHKPLPPSGLPVFTDADGYARFHAVRPEGAGATDAGLPGACSLQVRFGAARTAAAA